MFVTNVDAMSLGIIEKEGGTTKDGRTYDSYMGLGFVIEGEISSRKFYVPDNLQRRVKAELADWGTSFTLSGDIDASGRLSIEDFKVQSAKVGGI